MTVSTSLVLSEPYNPLPPATNWPERLVRGRATPGLSQKAFAQQTGSGPQYDGMVGKR
jgi:hypothetical protein